MRNRILGGIGVLWGGAMLLRFFLQRGSSGSRAYAAGQTAAVAFGALLFLVGLYYLIKGGRAGRGGRSERPSA